MEISQRRQDMTRSVRNRNCQNSNEIADILQNDRQLIRGEESVRHWQSSDDLPERRLMVRRVIAMTKHNGKLSISADEWGEKTPIIARRAELSLYSRAASFQEYGNVSTLRRRLKSLISLSYHEAESVSIASQNVVSNVAKRSRISFTSSNKVNSSSSSPLIDCNEDMLRHIFSFLNFTTIVHTTRVCRLYFLVLPSYAEYLIAESNLLRNGFQQHGSELLVPFTNLKVISIYKKDVMDPQVEQKALHAWACKELDITHRNTGEIVVKSIAEFIETGKCSKLEMLSLISLFTNTYHINAIGSLCNALSNSKCPSLRELHLGGNSISDFGAISVAKFLSSKSSPKIKLLDLRRNYIGEAGIEAIATTLVAGNLPLLEDLCLGGNIIADCSVSAIIHLLKKSACPQLKFLGLEDNFISTSGVKYIMEAAVSGGMMPRLQKVCQKAVNEKKQANNTNSLPKRVIRKSGVSAVSC